MREGVGDALPAKNAWVIVEKRKVDSPKPGRGCSLSWGNE